MSLRIHRTSVALVCATAFGLVAACAPTRTEQLDDRSSAADDPLAALSTAPPATSEPHPLAGLWRLRMERSVWSPRLVPGSLAVWDGPEGLRASVTFDPMWGLEPFPIDVESTRGDRVQLSLRRGGNLLCTLDVTAEEGVLTGTVEWSADPPETSSLAGERLAPPRRFEPDGSSTPFPRADAPAELGLDPVALGRLIHYAGESDTDALVVVKDGRLVCDRTFLRPRGPCTTQSITKAVSTLAIPILIDEGHLPRDLDTPLSQWFPTWKTGGRSGITLRHVLTHTTGLASDGTDAMQNAQDWLAYARNSDVEHRPGTHFAYSNQGIELLVEVLRQASGVQVDTFLAERVFAPLGIDGWRWHRDPSGNTPTYVGLDLTAVDLARIAWMVCRRGVWDGRQVVPEWWFDEIVKPSALRDDLGLVWWLSRAPGDEVVRQTQQRLDALALSGFADAAALEPLVGRTFESRAAWWAAATELLGQEGVRELYRHQRGDDVPAEVRGDVTCIQHSGSLGQWLLIFPQHDLVVVRQRRAFAADEGPGRRYEGFGNIVDLARDLVR